MNFEELKQILEKELGVVHLSDIARELGVSPQTVNNWKNRDTIPYKYIKKVKNIQSRKLRQSYDREIDKGSISFFGENINNEDADETEFFEQLIEFSKSLFISVKSHIKNIMLFTMVITTITIIYSLFFAPIVFHSQLTMIPLVSGNSTNKSIASQFGFQVNNGGSEIGSVQLIPDLVRLRSLHNAVLNRKFNFKNQQGKISLIDYYYGNKEDFKSNKELYYKLARRRLSNSLFLKKNKNNDIIRLTASGREAKFVAELASVVVEELMKIQNKINLSRVKEQGQYLIERIDSLSSELIVSEEKLKNFREKNRKISRSPKLLLDENRLVRELTTLELIYRNLKSEYEINRVEEIGDKKLIQILDEPLVPLMRTSPKRTLMVIQAFILALLISIAFASFYDNKLKKTKKSVKK